MRLIDADALPKYTGYALSADEVATAVENAPTIDAVPVVHGYWIKGTKCNPELVYCSDYNWTCSVCEYMDTHNEKVEVPYCWHCGARMDGDGNE